MEKQGRKIVVEFKNDNPNGIRIVKNPSFPFDAYIIPRCCMAETTNAIPEKKIGIYFLFDENRTQVYVGQTGDGIGRLQTHHQQKDFWSIAIMFLAEKDKWISLIDELETYSIIRLEKAEKGTRFKLQNKKKLGRKEESLTNLSEIKKIFFEIKFCLAAFEYNIETPSSKVNDIDSSMVLVQATRGGIKAEGVFYPKDGTIVVKANSEIRLDNLANSECVKKLRQEYKGNGKIKKVKGKYILQENVSFEKLSPAAEFVIGGSCNGKTEWKSDGKTLKDLFKL